MKNVKNYTQLFIAVIGGICLDRYFRLVGGEELSLHSKNIVQPSLSCVGGGAANVARVLRRLCSFTRIVLLAAVGKDSGGEHLCERMAEHDIEMPTIETDEPTSESLIVTDAVAPTLISSPGARAAELSMHTVRQALTYASALCLVAPVNVQIVPILQIANELRLPVYFGLGGAQIYALGLSGLHDAIANGGGVRLVICNRSEGSVITGMDELHAQLEAMLFGGLVEIAVITDGEEGIYALTRSGIFHHVPAYSDGREVLDTVGAGDSAQATIVYMLVRGHSLHKALVAGARQGFECVTAKGATTNLVDAATLEGPIQKAA